MQPRILTLAIASGLVAGMFTLTPTAHAAASAAYGAGNTSSRVAAATAMSSPAMQDDSDAMQDTGDSEFKPNDTISCEMDYTLTGWSVFYKSASGNGTVKCSNGKTMKVVLNVTGGGLTVGHYQVNDGHGDFTAVSRINQVLGDYAMATAHAGAAKSSRAMVLTNGDTSLTLTGTGNGWNIGAGFASFSIKRASAAGMND
ncbi:MAG TPA: hypothetical protein VFJ15_01225 [Oleiagrimonas sp.]|nr:hypothetical protein [Oleiagrimonas sp.]